MVFQTKSPLYVLRFDHRVPFLRGLFGIEEGQTVSAEQRKKIVDLKTLVYEALLLTLERNDTIDPRSVVAVIDEEYGASVAKAAKNDGIPIGISVERSGQNEFEFEYGSDFAKHVEEFEPEFVKALARYNSGGMPELNARQRDRLSYLSSWTVENGYPLMFELLIPPTVQQLDAAGGNPLAFELEQLLELVTETFSDFQGANIEADVWMLPGFMTREACEQTAQALHQVGKDDVKCVVLGQGPDSSRVIEWIQIAGKAHGYDGLAVAQTIWLPALTAFKSGSIDRATARTQISNKFIEAISAYTG